MSKISLQNNKFDANLIESISLSHLNTHDMRHIGKNQTYNVGSPCLQIIFKEHTNSTRLSNNKVRRNPTINIYGFEIFSAISKLVKAKQLTEEEGENYYLSAEKDLEQMQIIINDLLSKGLVPENMHNDRLIHQYYFTLTNEPKIVNEYKKFKRENIKSGIFSFQYN